MILDHIYSQIDQGLMSVEDEYFPLRAIEQYDSPSAINGVGSDEKSKLSVKHGIVLRVAFVTPVKPKDGYPYRDFYFKVHPKGSSD